MTAPRPELMPVEGAREGIREKWLVREGAPAVSRTSLSLTAESGDNARGESSRLVALVATQLEYSTDQAQLARLADSYPELAGLEPTMGKARTMVAQARLAEHGRALATIDSQETRQIGALV